MNLNELRDLIRAEANLEGLNEYQNLIDNLINQEFQRLTGLAKYSDLLKDFVFTQVVVNNFSFDLPDDFQLFSSITYTPYLTSPTLLLGSAFGPYTLAPGLNRAWEWRTIGVPRFFRKVGRTFKVYPYTDFTLNDTLTLSYYKRPELSLDTDIFPVESLIPAVQQFVMGRLLRMRDTRKSQVITAEANKAFISSRGEYGGN